ncbi:MAG: UDP-N-acetylmuramoyl-L-alanyl-D-glutamate--2,6-diaminopimelate ligase [bacterium]|nr:UDP-N-acetylmuramoyl-L-alanyl-D-glutamate--2,6-diaminopimelate ligase [bacterium]
MQLSKILENISYEIKNKNLDLDIKAIENNSSKVSDGALFIAIKGTKVNGADFIDDAIKSGAVAILTDMENMEYIKTENYKNIPFIFVENIRLVESVVASRFFPNQPNFVCAVTGTNGKSSVVNFIRQMWEFVNINSASIGTVGIHTSNGVGGKTLTTPDAIDLHKNLDSLALSDVKNVAIETSSHGIEQHRADSVKIKTAGFTNISNDHLDYHKTVDEYFNAKLRLFSELLDAKGTAVVNIDDERGQSVVDVCKSRGIKTITYGEKNDADIKLEKYDIVDDKQIVKISVFGKSYDMTLNLVTKFQIFNFMCALGMFISSYDDWEKVLPFISEIKNEKGRIEYVATTPNGAKIYVDFGHNGDGLKKLLTEFRPYVKHNLICIAGCSGDRPEIRRIEMGKVLNQYADTVIIVDDNPRTENPENIRKTLLSYCPKARCIPNRYDAINEVIDTSRDWDSIIICGTMYEKDKEFIRNKLALPTKPLNQLLKDAGYENSFATDTPIHLVSCDSKTIIEGSIFVGIKGFAQNGANYSYDAITKGAKAVVVEPSFEFDEKTKKIIDEKNIVVIRTQNPRKALADLVFTFYDKKQPEIICAITGTSGKSSIVDFTRQIWGLLKLPAMSIGTIGMIVENVYSQKEIVKFSDADHTTPGNGEAYKFLKYFKEKGVEYGAIELSSHGLDQLRMENIKISAAGFSNLGTDHLEFYGSYDAYLKSKSKLFRENLDANGTAVLNADVPEYDYLKQICDNRGVKVFSYGRNGCELKILSQQTSLEGQVADVELFGKKYHLDLKILGSFQLNNLMCALGMVAATTPDWERVIPLLGNVRNALGRLEYMGKTKSGASIYVDFAYKGEALENTLKTLRPMLKDGGRIINVFSTCGDIYEAKTRRFELGTIAYKYADVPILTDDSPRGEDPQKIRDEILKHCPNAIEIKTGRRDAIKKAMEISKLNDVILVAGKGHEDYVTFGTKNIPYTDQETILDLIKEGF